MRGEGREGCADHHADIVHEVLTAVTMTRINLDLLQRTVVVKRTTGVEQEVGIGDGVHATV